MKKHSFLILDDENSDSNVLGWKRVVSLFLKPKKYLIESAIPQLQEGINKVIGVDNIDIIYFQPGVYNYDSICEELMDDDFQNAIDVFFIDIKWDNVDAIKNTVVEMQSIEGFTIDMLKAGQIPFTVAGINLLNVLKKSDKPKIIFSGSDLTLDFRKYFLLFSNRLIVSDIIIGELIEGENSYSETIESKIAEYLQKKQISIINRQTAANIEAINSIIDSSKLKLETITKLLIPNDGVDTDPNNCWNLNTLFPQQINEILSNSNVNANKKYIKEVVNELNFRKLYKWIVGDHGGFDGKFITELMTDQRDKIINRLNILDYLENSPNLIVSGKAAQCYKLFRPLTDIFAFEKDCIEDIRKKIGNNLPDIPNLQINYITVIESKNPPVQVSFKHEGITKQLGLNFGVYIGDIYFAYQCIKGNNKHNLTTPPDGYLPEISITLNFKKDLENNDVPDSLIIAIAIATDNELFQKWENGSNPINRQKDNIDKILEKHPFNIVLNEQSIEDFVCLFCNRYQADIEIQIGKKRLKVDNKRITSIEDSESNKTEFIFTIKPI